MSKGKPINIIFLVDTSNSMGYVKNTVVNGLKNLLDSLKDNETYIEIGPMFNFSLTTTQTETYTLDASNNKVPKTAKEIQDLNHLDTYYKGYKRAPAKGSYHGYLSKTFSPTMTSAQRLTTYNDLINHVDKIFTAGGSYNGQLADIPLCVLMTQIQMIRAGSSSLNTNPQTPTLIYVATNEDDESKLHQIGESDTNITSWNLSLYGNPYCGLEFREKVRHLKNVSKTWGTYDAPSLSASIKVRAFYQSDGLETSSERTVTFVPGIPYRKLTTKTDVCPSDMATTHKADIDYNISLQISKHTRFEVLSCDLINEKDRSMLFEGDYNPEQDKCKSGFFTANASKYSGYDISACAFDVAYEAGQVTYGYNASGDITTNSFPGTDIIDAVSNEFAATFPTGNYFASFAILPSSGICPIDAGTSPGVRFEQLAGKLGKKATIVPVCQGQFSNSFIENAVNHLESKIGNDIFLDTAILKKINQIEIIKDGEKVVLEKTKDYSINGTSVVFTDGLLTAQTQIFIYYDL